MKIKSILLISVMILLVLAPMISAKNFNITDGSGSLFFVNGTSGNVGIGTSSPQTLLNIFGVASQGLAVQGIGTTATRAFLGLDASGDGYFSLTNGGTFAKNVQLSSDLGVDNYIMGDVGIGTATPTQELELIGDLNLSGKIYGGGVSTYYIEADSTSYFNDVNAEYFNLRDDGLGEGIRWNTGAQSISVASAAQGGYEGFVFDSDGGHDFIFTDGKVGINTTTPGNLLDVYGSDGATFTTKARLSGTPIVGGGSALFFKTSGNTALDRYGVKLGAIRSDADNGAAEFVIQLEKSGLASMEEVFRIDDDGNVGIGTSSPKQKLDVNGFLAVGNTTDGVMIWRNGVIGDIAGINTELNSYNDLRIRASLTDQLYLKTDGNVGIGTSSPDYLLEVVKDVGGAWAGSFTGSDTEETSVFLGRDEYGIAVDSTENSGSRYLMKLMAGAGSGSGKGTVPVFYATMDQKVGIGTSTPQNTLNVVGDANVTGALTIGGAWQDGGVSITDGSVYAQAAYFYNITGLNVSELNINGSLMPRIGFDNTFDIGGDTLRWRDLYVGRNAYVNGSVYADNFYGDGSGLTNLDSSAIDDIWVNESGDTMTGTLNINANLTVDTNTLFVDAESDRVGIGTSSPSELLQLGEATTGGNSYIRLNAAGGGYNAGIKMVGGTMDIWTLDYADTTNSFSIDEDGTDYLTILTGGNVGIGTTSPSYNLVVKGKDSEAAVVEIQAYDNEEDAVIRFAQTGAPVSYVGFDDSSQLLKFNNANGFSTIDHLVIDTAGQVGIGTDDPKSELHLDMKSASSLGTRDGSIFLQSFDNEGIGNYGSGIMFGQASGSTGEGLGTSINSIQTTADSNAMGLTFNVHGADSGSDRFEAMRIDEGGKVGIGTDSSDNLLHLRSTTGDVAISFHDQDIEHFSMGLEDGTNLFHISNGADIATTPVITINGSNNNVGIGTTSPDYQLQVQAVPSSYIQVKSTNADSTAGVVLSNDARNWVLRTYGIGDVFQIRDATANAQRLTIDSSGNVGIGGDPVANTKMAVFNGADGITAKFFGANTNGWRGTINVQDGDDYVAFYGYDQAGDGTYGNTWFGHGTNVSRALIVNGNTGQVGIGTSSPGAKLEILDDTTNPTLLINNSGSTVYDPTISLLKSGTDGAYFKYDTSEGITYLSNTRESIAADLIFRTQDTDRMTIDGSGNVGIGTTTPTQKLNVVGEINVTDSNNDVSMYMEGGVLIIEG